MIPVVVTYAVVGWLILQVAETTFEPLGLPEWGIRILIIITIAGFPAVFFFAWLIDIKSEGMMFDLPLWPNPEQINAPPTKTNQVVALTMCFTVIAGCIGLVFYLSEVFPKPDTGAEVQISGKSDDRFVDSIAVLAFENFHGDEQTDYFASGLAEEILNLLAKVKELNVAARTSSFRFKGEQVDIREVAEILKVKHVLEGSVRREGNRIRVSATLIDGVKGFQAWANNYDRDLESIFAIQQEIAAAVVNELKLALSVESQQRLQQVPTENIDAYVFYLQGREKLRSSKDKDVLLAAKQFFEQAIVIDPDYARAYAGQCEVHLGLYENSNDVDDFSAAQSACEKARRLDTELTTETQIALGRLFRFRGWYDKAAEQLNLAIAASPTSADAYIELGEALLSSNQLDEAKTTLSRAVDLKRNYWKAHEALANYYYMTEQYAESAQAYEVVTLLAPDLALGFGGKGAAYWMLGETQRALAAYEKSLKLKPSRQALTNLGESYYYAGEFEKAANMQDQALLLAPDDHRVWGRLAESYRFIESKQAESQDAYFRAAELASSNLEINPDDWLTKARLGLYKVYLDATSEGLGLIESAVEQSQRDPEVLYLNALALLQIERQDEAIRLLQEAVKIDASFRQFIALDPELQRLSTHASFQTLLPDSGVE